MNSHQLVSEQVAGVASGDLPVVDSTHVRSELLQLALINAQAMVTDNGVASLVGVGREVATCVAQWSIATLAAKHGDPQALAQCLTPLAGLDPSATTEAMKALHFGDIVATLAAASTPHSPSIVHALAPTPLPRTTRMSTTPVPATPEITPPPSSSTTPPSSTSSVFTAPVPSATGTQAVPPTTTPPGPQITGDAPTDTPAASPHTGRQYVAPTSGTITSSFGDGRSHQGIDIANSTGTPIVAVADGVVISSGPAQGFGLWVRIRHNDGTITTYGHNNENTVSVGQTVVAGREIATVGNRGESTGPHLHFEVQEPSGQNVDPVTWLAARDASIL
jgi:hypothetical protein